MEYRIKLEYWIRRPGGERKRFAIVERETRGGKARQIKDERIDSINKQLVAGTITVEEAHALCQQIKAEYQSKLKQRANYNDANLALFGRYWEERYTRRKIDPDSVRSAHNNYHRALSAVGTLSIAGSPIQDIQKAIDRLPNKRQRRVTNCINRMLQFCQRVERLEVEKKQRVRVAFLTPSEFAKVLKEVPEPWRLPVSVAFHAGMRLGEVFGDNRFNDLNQAVMVMWQLKRNKQTERYEQTETKTHNVRDAVVLKEGVEGVKRWFTTPLVERNTIRTLRWSEIVGEACERAGVARCKFHDLRHSYAIELLTRGAPLELVALSMGNSVAVCQEHYVGYVLTNAMAQALKKYAG